MTVSEFKATFGNYLPGEDSLYGKLGRALEEWKATEDRLATAMRIVRYCSLDQHAVFDGSAPNSCGSCRHPDCLANEQEWVEMRKLVESLVSGGVVK